VNKHLFVIAFLIAAFTLIAHDAIPHHHSAMEESELNVSHILKDSYDDQSKNENDHDHDHEHPIPRHQHVFAPDDYIGRRNYDSVQKVIRITITNYICLSTFFNILENNIPQDDLFKSLKILPDPYPFIISPNAMRGSPANV
jgi:hypothetical protein